MFEPVWYCPLCFLEGTDPDVAHCPKDGSPVSLCADREAEWVGKTLDGKYKVIKFLGAGGMADVFEVERISSGKRLALKLLKSSFTGDAHLMERFRQEAILISLIAHRNIVALEDFGVLDNKITYMAMELLSGYTLGDALELGPMDPATAFQLILQACEGMAAAHERGVIHRDLKPENLFIQKAKKGSNPVVKILDLGIGKLFKNQTAKGLTMAGTVVGTPHYMSPEQCKGEPSGIPTDIYSMGIVLYEMLFSQVPFDDTSPILILPKHISETPKWDLLAADCLGIPPETEQVVMRALAKKPSDRHENMTDLQRDIARLRSRVHHGKRYSLPAPDQLKKTRITIAPPPSIATQPTMAIDSVAPAPADASPIPADNGILTGPEQIADGIYWVGRHHGRQLECNSYLRVFNGNGQEISMLIDPGSPRDFDAVKKNVEAVIGSIDNLNYIFLNHQDPDVAGNAAELQRKNQKVIIICAEDTWRIAQHFGLDPNRYIPTRILPGMKLTFNTGHSVQFVPTPFCHDRGAVMAYDTSEAILFSGDMFGGISAGDGLMYSEQSLQGIQTFHQIYMPSRKALARALQNIRDLSEAPRMIAPQHGNIIPEEYVPILIDEVGKLKVGIDLIVSNEKNTGTLNVANEILRIFKGVAGLKPQRALIKRLGEDPDLVALFEMREPDQIVALRVDPRVAIRTLLAEVESLSPTEHKEAIQKKLTPIRMNIPA